MQPEQYRSIRASPRQLKRTEYLLNSIGRRRAGTHWITGTVVLSLIFSAVVAAPAAQADPTAATPSAEQLTNQLSVILDTTAPIAQRASYLQAGDSAMSAVNALATPIAQHRSMISLQIEDPTVAGDQVASQLVMSVAGMGSQRRPLNWIAQNGQWKLSNGSLCDMLREFGGSETCPA